MLDFLDFCVLNEFCRFCESCIFEHPINSTELTPINSQTSAD